MSPATRVRSPNHSVAAFCVAAADGQSARAGALAGGISFMAARQIGRDIGLSFGSVEIDPLVVRSVDHERSFDD